MKFGEALEALEAGERVARSGWNGKGMWLVLVPASTIPAFTEGLIGGDINAHIIDMKTATGEMQPGWLASQADMLAKDWEVL